jgi:hypothetical protein
MVTQEQKAIIDAMERLELEDIEFQTPAGTQAVFTADGIYRTYGDTVIKLRVVLGEKLVVNGKIDGLFSATRDYTLKYHKKFTPTELFFMAYSYVVHTLEQACFDRDKAANA